MKRLAITASLSLLFAYPLYVVFRARSPAVSFAEDELKKILQHSPLTTPPPESTDAITGSTTAQAHLGKRLFFDKRLSGNGKISCATCHNPQTAWSDGKVVSEGIGVTTRHTPTILNTAYNRWYFWDGRSDSLASQALNPLESPDEHGGSRLQYAHLIYNDPELKRDYESVFGPLPDLRDKRRFPEEGRPVPSDPTDPHHAAWTSMTKVDQYAVNRLFYNLGKAIAAFEQRIISRDSPFDIFVEGLKEHDAEKLRALSVEAQRGLKLFIGKANCSLCHSGPSFTDGEFHNIRLPRRSDEGPDPGRYSGINLLLSEPLNEMGLDDGGRSIKRLGLKPAQSHDWGRFKTPTLRNVAQSAPYMHNGRFATLAEVVRFYSTLEGAEPAGHHEEAILIPLNLTEAEIADLITFLESLTGKVSGFDTAKKD